MDLWPSGPLGHESREGAHVHDRHGGGAGRLPLSALLSQVLLAFIIEFDNEFERQMPATDGGRGQVATLTPRGRSVQNKSRERLGGIEHRWQERFGGGTVTALRGVLERLTSGPGSRLSEGLDPPPGGWRAGARGKATLPQYPMVLDRGGFPDGS